MKTQRHVRAISGPSFWRVRRNTKDAIPFKIQFREECRFDELCREMGDGV